MKIISFSKTYSKLCTMLGPLGIDMYHKFVYHSIRGRWPNFRHPQDLSERLLSSMSKKEFKQYAKYADKVEVREYIKAKGLGDHLLDVYGVWEKAEDIDFDSLPNKFALKPNNGSGGHFICYDKSSIKDIQALRKQMNESLILGRGYHWEPHYLEIKPRIYAEELIETPDKSMPTDYKFTCVNGKIVDCFICTERHGKHCKYITLDTDWNELPYTKDEYRPSTIPAKPKHLKEMIEMAKILSADFKCVRVDLYEYKDKVYFGELTFSPWGGYMYSYNDKGIKAIGAKFDE